MSQKQYDVVLGPCPGCESWQLDYTDAAAGTFHTGEAFYAVIEDLLGDHLEECPHLRQLLAEDEISQTRPQG